MFRFYHVLKRIGVVKWGGENRESKSFPTTGSLVSKSEFNYISERKGDESFCALIFIIVASLGPLLLVQLSVELLKINICCDTCNG